MTNKKLEFDMQRGGVGTSTVLPLWARAKVIAETTKALKLAQETTKNKEKNEEDIKSAMNRADIQAILFEDPLRNKL